MDRRIYAATKSPLPKYEAVTFSHPAFPEPLRLVANQFAPVVLGGFEHMPVPMTMAPPRVAADARPSMTVAFPRAVVGKTFMAMLKLVDAYAARQPIDVVYAEYCGATDVPSVTWELFIGDLDGVSFSADVVSVSAVDNNPMLRRVAAIYDPSVFTGLQLI